MLVLPSGSSSSMRDGTILKVRLLLSVTAVLCGLPFVPNATSEVDAVPQWRMVPTTAGEFEYLGFWQRTSTNAYTSYAGAQIRFSLQGRAILHISSGCRGTIRIQENQHDPTFHDKRLTTSSVLIDGGATSTVFSVIYMSTVKDVSTPGNRLCFSGCSLAPDAHLTAPQQQRSGPLIAFVGDSITCGGAISGRQRPSDVTLTYGYLLAEATGARYWIQGIPGARVSTVLQLFRAGTDSRSLEHPDFVFINLGANTREESSRRYRKEMRLVVEHMLQESPQAEIVLINFMRMTPNRLPDLEAVASRFPKGAVTVFDARRFLVNYTDNGVHPDKESHARLANALVSFVGARFARQQTQ